MQKYILLLASIFFMACGNDQHLPNGEVLLAEKEVIDFVNEYDNMWASRDTAAMKGAMAEDYVYFTSVGSTITRDKIISWFAPADKYKVDTAIRNEIIVNIHGNTAVVSSRWIGSGSFDGEKFSDDQRCSLIIQKKEGKLKLISEHCTQIVNQH